MFPDAFPTARLRAERLTSGHFDDLRAMDSDPDFMAWLGGVRDAGQTEQYLSWNLGHWAEYGFGLWVLRDAEGRLAGRAVIRHLDVDGTDEVELGYGLLPRYWRQGLGTEVARELLRLGTHELHLTTMVAITRHTNIGSQRVLENAGLVYERDVDHDGIPHLLFRWRSSHPTLESSMVRVLVFLLAVLTACELRDVRPSDAATPPDTAFAAMQARGQIVMGVDQYASAHVFEDLPDGGRVVLDSKDPTDSAAITAIRAHMREIAAAFRAGDFAKPFQVHAQAVPGSAELTARRAAIAYEVIDRPAGGEVRIRTRDAAAARAVHQFLEFQRGAHRAAGHEEP